MSRKRTRRKKPADLLVHFAQTRAVRKLSESAMDTCDLAALEDLDRQFFTVMSGRGRYKTDSTIKTIRRENHHSRQPRTPTPHPPGSLERLEAMAARAARGETLFHPQDGQFRPELKGKTYRRAVYSGYKNERRVDEYRY